ncbi:HAMP domain-containing sensor histidine kinase [Paracoccaceae bacterium Fryx2]|nr:HAMP domain-containing sensor histidine kinase [Paracoccaceae bacterium Fryx2]
MRLSGSLPLSIKVPMIAAGMMVLVGVVASQQVMTALGKVQEDRLRELARLHVDGLAIALGPAVLRRDVWEVYDILDRARQAMAGQRTVLTVVADEDGAVVAASDPNRAPVDSDLGPLLAGAQTIEQVTLAGADAHVRVLADLTYQGRTVGKMLTELDVSDLAAERRRVLVLLLAGNALATLTLATGGYLAMRRMLRPVTLLSARMSAAEGQPEAIAEAEIPVGDKELARLFRTYNAMVEAGSAKADAERRLAERERFVSLGRLSSSLAHEINNPLGGLLNATDTILSYADRPEVVRDAAALLDRGLRHLRDVARATLEQNRMDRQGVPLAREDFADLKLLFEPETVRQGQRLDWRVDAADLARWQAMPVRQIALNLLLNASQAAGHGGTVGLRVADTPEGLDLRVSDDGPGLTASAATRLLSDDRVPPGGGGVGLRLVRELASRTGARIVHARGPGLTEIRILFPERAAP